MHYKEKNTFNFVPNCPLILLHQLLEVLSPMVYIFDAMLYERSMGNEARQQNILVHKHLIINSVIMA